MRSTFHSLEIAKRSLFTQQAALSTTGHNIANANTEGYSRQTVNMTAARPLEAPGMMRSNAPGQLGMGVEFTSITRIREKFLDDQFRNGNKDLGNWEIQADTLSKLETIVNEPSDTGIRTVLDNFWKSWSDLATDPENVTGRKLVRENAIALADAFNYTSKQLSDLSNDLTTNIGVKASEMNSITSTIARLNDDIMRVEGLGDDANDLRDQRDLLTDQLSKIANITVTDGANGYTINLGATNLVTYKTTTPVTAASLTDAVASGSVVGGEVYGMITSRDRYVADYQKQLDTLANTIANGEIQITLPEGSVLPDNSALKTVASDGTVSTVTYTGAARTVGSGGLTIRVDGLNGLQKLGYTVSGSTLQTGIEFFTSKDGSANLTASTIQINPLIADSADRIATSLRTEGSGSSEKAVKGNNTLANLIGQLKNTDFSFVDSSGAAISETGTIDDYFGAIVGQIGIQSQEATRQLKNQDAIVGQIDSNRQSVSGVSLDEEMSNLIKFQKAYSAAARFMTTMDEMLDKIINGMGVVGR